MVINESALMRIKIDYVENNTPLDVVESSDSGKYRALQKALTLTPSKPSFSFKGE